MNPGRVKVPYYAFRRGGMLKINTSGARLGRQNADAGKLLIVNGFETGEKTREKIRNRSDIF